MDPRFSTVRTAIVFLIPNMLIFLESGGPGQHFTAKLFLILGYGKKSDFRGGTPNLCIKSSMVKVNRGEAERVIQLHLFSEGEGEPRWRTSLYLGLHTSPTYITPKNK